MNSYNQSYLKQLESESIHIMREVVAEFKNPVMLYSVGKDSSVMVRLAQKAFYPGKFPFPLMHVDTGYKFKEMYEFRDTFVKDIGAKLLIYKNEEWIARGTHPSTLGCDKCCAQLKTQALLDGIKKYGFDAAFGGARREEEKSRAKERIFSLRDEFGQWDPKNQRPELWDLYNARINEGQSVRVFPLSNWTEQDIWHYIKIENIPIVPLYFSKVRKVITRGGVVVPIEELDVVLGQGAQEKLKEFAIEEVPCRFRSLGCIPCTGAVRSTASNLDEVIAEVAAARKSERENRVIDQTSDSSMEQKKKDGYF
jgi:sulfate adenylyltransferase subunit 2